MLMLKGKRAVSYHGNSGSARKLNICVHALLAFVAFWSLKENPGSIGSHRDSHRIGHEYIDSFARS